jgi:hypothetical protein
MTQICPKLALGLEFWTKQSKIYLLSEVRGSDPNFGQRGFFYKKEPKRPKNVIFNYLGT